MGTYIKFELLNFKSKQIINIILYIEKKSISHFLINEMWDTGWINIVRGSRVEKLKVTRNSYFRANFRFVSNLFIFASIGF